MRFVWNLVRVVDERPHEAEEEDEEDEEAAEDGCLVAPEAAPGIAGGRPGDGEAAGRLPLLDPGIGDARRRRLAG